MAGASVPAGAQQETPYQAPAPIVRARPRAQAIPAQNAPADAAPLVTRPARPRVQTAPTQPSPAQTAPADAAPLVARPPRPRPIDPSTLGSSAATGTTSGTAQTTPRIPRTAQPGSPTPAAPARGAATASTGTTSASTSSTPKASTAATGSTPAKPASTNGLNRTTIVLDPGHGGQDSGSRIGDNILEKDVTLSLALRLRTLLTARGFTVVLTREGDLPQPSGSGPASTLTLDDRAGIANHARAAACLLLHATGRGNGVHMYSSDLEPALGDTTPAPWLTAQAAWIPASQQLGRDLASALNRSHLALVSSAASIRPVNSLTCPALVLELAPDGDNPRSVTDTGYQDRVAAAVAGALVFWQNEVQPPPRLNLGLPATHTVHHRPATTPKPEETQP